MENSSTLFMSELTEIFRKRQKQFVQFAYSYVRDQAEAEDIVMSAFTTVWERRDALQEHTNISALLLTAVKNRSLNYIQHQQIRQNAEQHINQIRQKEVALRIATLEACEPEHIFSQEMQLIVQQAIYEIPEASRRIFMLSHIDNLSNKEIAKQLDLSVKTVEYHITRSLKLLRTKLKDYAFTLFFI